MTTDTLAGTSNSVYAFWSCQVQPTDTWQGGVQVIARADTYFGRTSFQLHSGVRRMQRVIQQVCQPETTPTQDLEALGIHLMAPVLSRY